MIDLVLCASGSDEVRLVGDIAREASARARVVRRCADLAEATAVAAAGIGDVVVLDTGVRGLTRDAAAEILRCGVPVIGLRSDDGERGAGVGLTAVLPASATVHELLDLCERAMAGESEEDVWEEAGHQLHEPRGRLVAVWGPVGAPGRSTLAVNLAAEIAALERETVLVDADTYGPSLTQMLGVLDEAPGMVAACRAASRGTLDERTLESLLPVVRGKLRLLSGIGVAARWAEVRGASLDQVWTALLQREAIMIVDVAGPLEEDEELTYDTAAPQRNVAAISALQRADVLLAVVGADPVSITRLVRERDRLAKLTGAELHVVVNRLGPPVPEARVRELLSSRLPATAVHVLPEDTAACRRASWEGALLSECAPRSVLRRSIRDLAARLAGPEPGSSREEPSSSDEPGHDRITA